MHGLRDADRLLKGSGAGGVLVESGAGGMFKGRMLGSQDTGDFSGIGMLEVRAA